MATMGLVLGVLASLTVGLAVGERLSERDKNMPPELLFGLSFPLGAAIIGLLVYLDILFILPVFSFLAFALGPLAMVSLIVRRRHRNWGGFSLPLWLALVIALLTVAALLLASFIPYRGGDGLWVHGFKARHLLSDPTAANPIFHDPDIVHCNEYTPLWPAAFLVFLARLGAGWSRWPHLALVLFYPSLLLFMFGLLREYLNRRRAALLTLALAVTPAYGLPLGGVYSHYVDVPISFFMVATASLLARHLKHGSPGSLSLAVLFGTAMVYTKNEGLPVFALLLLFTLAVLSFSRSARHAGWHAGLLTLALTVWPLPFHLQFRSTIRTTHYDIWFRDLSLNTLWTNLPRLTEIAWSFLGECTDPRHWGLWWLFLAGAVAVAIRRRLLDFSAVLLLPIVTVLGASFFVYWQDFMDFRQHITWSLDRVILQCLPCAMLFIGIVSAQILANDRHPEQHENIDRKIA